jgi:hypothetical protein
MHHARCGRSRVGWLVYRGRADLRRSLWRSNGSCSGEVIPAAVVWLPLLLAEGQPNLYLPAMTPKGRQCSVWLVAMVFDRSGLVDPSGFIPSADEEHLVWMLRTRSRFFILPRGPFCIMQGLVCNFMFSVCMLVKFLLLTKYQ